VYFMGRTLKNVFIPVAENSPHLILAKFLDHVKTNNTKRLRELFDDLE